MASIRRLSDKTLAKYKAIVESGEELTPRQQRALEGHALITNDKFVEALLRPDTVESKPSLFVDCPSCGKGEHHMDGCPLENEIPAIPATTELHPAGTRARIAALEQLRRENSDAYATLHERHENALFRESELSAKVEALEADLKQARAELVDRVGPTITLIGELLTLLRAGAGEDSPEYARALELIGAPPQGDVSTPFTEAETRHALTGEHDDDPQVLRILHSVNQQESE